MSYGGSCNSYFNWTVSEFLGLCWYNLIGNTLAAQTVAYQRHLRLGDTAYAPPEAMKPVLSPAPLTVEDTNLNC